jgi:hypothetical protein
MRNIVYVILAIGGYILVLALAGNSDLEILLYIGYLTWLPFGVFIWWRLRHLIKRRVPRSLLFAAIFGPALFNVYGYVWIPNWMYYIIRDSIAEPGNQSLEYFASVLAIILPSFLIIWIVTYTVMSLWSSKRFTAWRDAPSRETEGFVLLQVRPQLSATIGLMVSFIIAGAIALGFRGERYQVVAEPNMQPALSFSSAGAGPISISYGRDLLLHFQPNELASKIEFVKSLTLHIATTDSSRFGMTTVVFSLWDFKNAWWGVNNQMDHKLAWRESHILFPSPDNYVSRTGEFYLLLRNDGGTEPVELADINFTLVVQNTDGTESVYAPSH